MEKVLVAEDSTTQRRLFAALLAQQSLEAVEVATGTEALEALLRPDGPRVALLDWEMPGLSGVEVCRKVRAASLSVRPHLILLTGRTERADVIEALQSGADDYLSKPPHPGELQARVNVGLRNLGLQREVQRRIEQLEGALRRLEVVGAVAAQTSGKPVVAAATKTGALGPALEALDAFSTLPERFAAVVSSFRSSARPPPPSTELWAHLALALPAQGAWLDVTLQVGRALAGEAFTRLSGMPATSEQSLLDGVSDVLSLVVRGVHQQLEARGVEVLKPLAVRGFVGALAAPATARRACFEDGGWALTLLETEAPLVSPKFLELQPGTMLVRALTPPRLPDVEVLTRGTVLKPSYLARARPFFAGDAAETPVAVMVPSSFALER